MHKIKDKIHPHCLCRMHKKHYYLPKRELLWYGWEGKRVRGGEWRESEEEDVGKHTDRERGKKIQQLIARQ